MRKTNNQLWIEKNNDEYIIGVTEELQDEVGEIGYVAITSAEALTAGDTLVELEASKAVVEIPSPLTGTVLRRNDQAEDHPEKLDSTDANDHWLVVLSDVSEEEFQSLS